MVIGLAADLAAKDAAISETTLSALDKFKGQAGRICKMVEEVLWDHQGWITARTTPGQGATFHFGLPL